MKNSKFVACKRTDVLTSNELKDERSKKMSSGGGVAGDEPATCVYIYIYAHIYIYIFISVYVYVYAHTWRTINTSAP